MGLCLFAQQRYAESERYLAKGLQVMLGAVGVDHVAAAVAIYNCYFCLHAQGRLSQTALPKQFTDALPQIRDTATAMMARKVLTLTVMTLGDLVEALKYSVPRQ